MYGNAYVNYGCVNLINAAVFTMHVSDDSIELSAY